MSSPDNVVKPVVAITMGDAAGIGPEIIAKSLAEKDISELCNPVIIGSSRVMSDAAELVRSGLQVSTVSKLQDAKFVYGNINVVEPKGGEIGSFQAGKINPNTGRAAVHFIRKAAKMCLNKQCAALVTAPINKASINSAGFDYPGHTEMLAELTGSSLWAMMLVGGPFRIIFVTVHTPLREVSGFIRKRRVAAVIKLAHNNGIYFGCGKPHLAVAGFNPHSGEGGLFGDEEKEIIQAIDESRREGINVEGPFPPDTVFMKARDGEFDIVVAMYHDQGHIPFKLIAFDTGVNVTVGLPIIRTSVDHGTAFDIAWEGKADAGSLLSAIKLAVKMRNSDVGTTL